VSVPYIRLHFVVEGQTEQTFVNNSIKSHLWKYNKGVDVRCVQTGRRGSTRFRGGIVSYRKLKNDLQRWMKQDNNDDSWFTSMIDLYGLNSISDEFPGYDEALQFNDPYKRVAALEKALYEDVSRDINFCRFIPYIQLHEFEALLLVDPGKMTVEFPEHSNEVEELAAQVKDYDSPERIDDGENTSPSSRIIALIPQYDGRKPSSGPIIADKIGLSIIKERCPHFKKWMEDLESLPEPGSTGAGDLC